MRYWIVKNTVNTTDYVKKGYAAIGWSDCEFDKDNIDATISNVEEKYKGLSGRHKGVIRRFLTISKGDIVLVPCYKGFYMGYATGEYRHLDECVKPDDRANVRVVEFIKDENGEPLYYKREGKNTALSTKIGSRHLLLEIRDEILKKEINNYINAKEDISIENRICNYENKERDLLKTKIKEALNDYSKIWLDAKGVGFEKLVSNLFETEGYDTYILSKRTGGSGIADADILAIKRSRLSTKFNEVIYIQAKHHNGETGIWGYEQIKAFKEIINRSAEDNDGIATVRDINKNNIEIESDHIKYVLISSAKISSVAYEENEKIKGDDEVILIDGEDLSGMIVEHIDEIDSTIRCKLGLIKQFIYIDDYKSGE